MLNEIPFSRPYYLLALSHYQSYPPNEEKYEFIQMTLQKTNPHILNWDYSIDDHESSHSFDFSKTPDIADFSALRGIPIDRLNIDNSNLRDSKELSFLLVDSISMLNTHIGAFEVILTIPTLNTLIIDRDAHPSWDFSKYPNVNVIRK